MFDLFLEWFVHGLLNSIFSVLVDLKKNLLGSNPSPSTSLKKTSRKPQVGGSNLFRF